jgi:cysteine-rich repeat protein
LNPCNGIESCEDGQCVAGTWADNGSACDLQTDAAKRVCSNGNCILSFCGDGYVDERTGEVCDDANADNADGCTVSCAYSCTADDQCTDGEICNGDELCDDELHACVIGDNADDGIECGTDLLCHGGHCVAAGCGNGELEAGEECDDGNPDDGDGCDADCTFTCTEDAQCDDTSVCTGTETCDPELHVCLAGEAMDCQPADECHTAECDPVGGCYDVLIDGDGDGYASTAYSCGDDCDDGDPTIYAGAAELCDQKDNNCNDSTDETAPTWYPDCDGDGFAAGDAYGVKQCSMPASAPPECAGLGLVGAWTSRAPVSGDTDCYDSRADVHPMNASENDSAWSIVRYRDDNANVDFDYNCDGSEEMYPDSTYVDSAGSCTTTLPIYTLESAVLAQSVNDSAIVGTPIIVYRPCYGSAGWISAQPECGANNGYTYCTSASGTCARTTSYDTAVYAQKCR